MNRKILFLLLVFTAHFAAAQDSARQKIAIFAPLYLDSAFNDTSGYRYAKNVFPKFINPGLEFYEGVQLALDSMNKEHIPLEVFVYDTRSATTSLSQQIHQAEQEGVGLMIAHCTANEIRSFADAGQRSHIPVININMPNDGGVTNNPNYVILNPTLKTQCEGIYKYIQKYYAIDPVVVFRRKGALEDRIKTYFEEAERNTASLPLKIKWVDLTDSFTLSQLSQHLDTSKQTLCISGSLDEHFGKKLVQSLNILIKQKYQAAVMGMPTWDNIPLNKSEYRGIEVTYSTPFYNMRIDKVSRSIVSYFNQIMAARPSDMVFRGFEVAWKFGKLLVKHGNDLSANLSSKLYKVFTEYDIQPVMNKQSTVPDYLENKKLYFLRWEDGVIKAIY